MIRIRLFRIQNWGPLFLETPIKRHLWFQSSGGLEFRVQGLGFKVDLVLIYGSFRKLGDPYLGVLR